MVFNPALDKRFKKKNLGFTLLEVVIVLTVVVMLAVSVLWSFQKQRSRGVDGRRKADLKNLQVILEDYFNDKGCYPTSAEMSCDPGTSLQPYITKLPCEPGTKNSYFYEPGPGSCPLWYNLYTNVEDTTDQTIGRNCCAGSCGPNLAYNWKVSSPDQPCGLAAEYYGCIEGACVRLPYADYCRPNTQEPDCGGPGRCAPGGGGQECLRQ